MYVHVPFCRQLCPYCDFAVAVRKQIPHKAYADAVVAELRARAGDLEGREVATVYFGGGTPALLDPASLEHIVAAVLDCAPTPREMTIEANPLDVTPHAAQRWRAMGFDRLSLGVQSFDPQYLRALGRDHGAADARNALETALAADLVVSMDLIYGGPHHEEQILRRDLELVAELRPHHVSAYQLTVEEGTVFGRRAREGRLALPDEEARADLSDRLIDSLAEAGFERYEVSSYARDGFIGHHNAGYWTGAEYLGVGTGAHSLRIDGVVTRRANDRRLASYLARDASAAVEETVAASDHLRERLFLALRTRLGVSVSELTAQFAAVRPDLRPWLDALLEPMRAEGLVERSDDVVRPTPRGLDFADTLAQRVWDG